MTVVVAPGRSRVTMPASPTGRPASSITLPSSGVWAFSASAAVPATPQTAAFIQFPAPWTKVTDNAGIRVIIHNFSVTTPVKPTFLNADGSVFNASMSTVDPGGGHSSLGLTNETVPGVPTTALKLALANTVVGDAAGFNVEVLAWAV